MSCTGEHLKEIGNEGMRLLRKKGEEADEMTGWDGAVLRGSCRAHRVFHGGFLRISMVSPGA